MTWGKDKAPRPRGSFEQEWPDLARGLDRTLRARHVPAARREDIIQETGLRLFVRWSTLDPERPLWPFAITIATNLLRDEQRMQARRSAAPQPIPELVDRGVEDEALARLELMDVQTALQRLTPAQRSVLLADLGAAPYDDRGAAALKMLRMRARRTLRNAIDRASALLPLGASKFRKAVNSLATTTQRATVVEQVQGVALSTLGVAGAATIIGATLGMTGATSVAQPSDGTMVAGVQRSSSSEGVQTARHAAFGRRPDGEPTAGSRAIARRGRPRSAGHGNHGNHGAEIPDAQVSAGGTGIDEEPSLESDRYRLSVFARAEAAGHDAVVDSEVEQSNPSCASAAASPGRNCVRPSKPSTRSRVDIAGHGTDDLIPKRYR